MESLLAVFISVAYPALPILMVCPALGSPWVHLSWCRCGAGCQFWAAGFTFWSVKFVDNNRDMRNQFVMAQSLNGGQGPLDTPWTHWSCDRWDTGIHITYCFQLIVLTEGDSDDCCNSDLLLSELWMLDSKRSTVREKEDQPETMAKKWWGYIAPLITRGYYALGDWMPFIVNLKKHF